MLFRNSKQINHSKTSAHVLKTITALALLIGVGASTGCNNNSSKGNGVSQPARSNVPGAGGLSNLSVLGGYAPGEGKIFADPQYSSEFTQAVKYMLAAYIDPANVGSVDPTNGISFKAYVAAGTTGAVDPSSAFLMEIRDSFLSEGKDENGNQIKPIELGAAAVQANLITGKATVSFRSSNGNEYVFDGTYNEREFAGTFKFSNTTSFSSSEPRRTGTMSFTIPTCNFFKCQ